MPEDIRDLWRGQQTEPVRVTLEDIRQRARKFERRIFWRNVREYVAGIIIIPFFAAFAFRNRGWAVAPPLLEIAGVLFVLFELHRRAASKKSPSDAGLKSSIESYVQELERQRKAVASVWLWYLMPFMPGLVASMFASRAKLGTSGTIRFAAFVVVMFGAIWALNARGARKLGERIKELKAISVDGEEDV